MSLKLSFKVISIVIHLYIDKEMPKRNARNIAWSLHHVAMIY